MNNEKRKAPYHNELKSCPLQCKVIAGAIQRYVSTDPDSRVDIFNPINNTWGFGIYWAIAKQLIAQPYCDQIAEILSGVEDRDEVAHRLVFFFWNDEEQVISPESLVVAHMTVY